MDYTNIREGTVIGKKTDPLARISVHTNSYVNSTWFCLVVRQLDLSPIAVGSPGTFCTRSRDVLLWLLIVAGFAAQSQVLLESPNIYVWVSTTPTFTISTHMQQHNLEQPNPYICSRHILSLHKAASLSHRATQPFRQFNHLVFALWHIRVLCIGHGS